MKKYQINIAVVIFLSSFAISCNESKPKSNSFWDAGEYIPDSTPLKLPETDWDKLEKEVVEAIEDIENSDSTNRYERLNVFIGYAGKVDGGISEVYSNFSFEYADSNYAEFYSVLTFTDTLLIDEWAKRASLLVMIVAENEDAEFIQDFSKKYKLKIASLPSDKQKLGNYYLKRLSEYSTGDWLSK